MMLVEQSIVQVVPTEFGARRAELAPAFAAKAAKIPTGSVGGAGVFAIPA